MACVFKTEFSVNILKLSESILKAMQISRISVVTWLRWEHKTSTHMIKVFWDSQMGGKKALMLPASHLCFCIPTWLPEHNNRTTDPNRLLWGLWGEWPVKSHSIMGSALHAIDSKGFLFSAITWSRDGSHTKSVWSQRVPGRLMVYLALKQWPATIIWASLQCWGPTL